MTHPFPGPPATQDHLRAAQERDRLLDTELPRARAAATAWRNGLAGLLTALAGFSIIKGQSDISRLARPWAAAVGIVLLGAFLAGAVGAVLLIRAATGRPAVVRVSGLVSRTAGDHDEALAAASALRAGIALTLACSGLLVAAVGVTWYGPSRTPPALQVTTPTGTDCGSLLEFGLGRVTIDKVSGVVMVPYTQMNVVRPVT
jgi:hypothetical protein